MHETTAVAQGANSSPILCRRIADPDFPLVWQGKEITFSFAAPIDCCVELRSSSCGVLTPAT